MFSINPDAHSIDELDLARWGVLVAGTGGISARARPQQLGSEEDNRISRRMVRLP